MPDTIQKCTLRRVRINSQAYDSTGTYWGHDIPLFEYRLTEDGYCEYIRAFDREDAKRRLREKHPNIKFYR